MEWCSSDGDGQRVSRLSELRQTRVVGIRCGGRQRGGGDTSPTTGMIQAGSGIWSEYSFLMPRSLTFNEESCLQRRANECKHLRPELVGRESAPLHILPNRP